MRIILAALLLSASRPALGAATGTVRRGELVVRVKVSGTVVPEDVFRLKSTIEGRVESIAASSFSWRTADQPLAMLAHRELAAMLDAKGVVGQQLLEDRWSRVYKPTPVRCPDACYVLKVYATERVWVKPQSVMFEAAANLRLVGRVRPEDAPLIRDGMPLTIWSVKDPKHKIAGRVAHFIIDIQGQKVEPGGTFWLYLSPDRTFDPGTELEGEIIPSRVGDALIVPTAALIHHDGATYLPVRISTGLTTQDLTQISAGASDKQDYLILDDSEMRGTERHKQTVDRAALERRRREIESAAAPNNPSPVREDGPRERQPTTIDEKDYGGEDPYGDQ